MEFVLLVLVAILITAVLFGIIEIGLWWQECAENKRRLDLYWGEVRKEARERQHELDDLESRIVNAGHSGYRS